MRDAQAQLARGLETRTRALVAGQADAVASARASADLAKAAEAIARKAQADASRAGVPTAPSWAIGGDAEPDALRRRIEAIAKDPRLDPRALAERLGTTVQGKAGFAPGSSVGAHDLFRIGGGNLPVEISPRAPLRLPSAKSPFGPSGFTEGSPAWGGSLVPLGRAFLSVPTVKPGARGTVSIDAQDATLLSVLRALANRMGLSFVIAKGSYADVSLVLSDLPLSDALEIVCRAADANLREERGVYQITPRRRPPTAPAPGGFGSGTGGAFGSGNGGGFGG